MRSAKYAYTRRTASERGILEQRHINKNINTLNYLQTIKRERLLSIDEIRHLCDITEDANASEQEKIGAYLLLDNKISAEIHFEKLTAQEQENFKQFPISAFWN